MKYISTFYKYCIKTILALSFFVIYKNPCFSSLQLVDGFDLRMNLKKGETFYIGNKDEIPSSLNFSNKGDKMFVVGSQTNTIFQYELSDPFNLNTTIETEVVFDLSKELAHIVRIAFSTTGDKLYIIKEQNFGGQGDIGIFQYSLNKHFDLSSINPEPEFRFNYDNYFSVPEDIYFDPSGKWAYITDRGIGDIYQYELTTPFDLSTAQFIRKKGVLDKSILPSSIAFDPSGKHLFITSGIHRYFNTSIYQYNLSVPYDLSTAELSYHKSLEKITSVEVNGLSFNTEGTALYVIDSKFDQVTKIELFTHLEENEDDKGGIKGFIPIQLKDRQFNNPNHELIYHTDYEIANLQEGLIPHVITNDDQSYALLSLTGQTLYHTENFSQNHLSIKFKPSAFINKASEVTLELPEIKFYGKAPTRFFEWGELVLFLLTTLFLIATLVWFKRSILVKYISIACGFILLIAYDFYVSSTYGVQMLGPYNIYYRIGIILSITFFVGIAIKQSKKLAILNEQMAQQISQYVHEITELKSELDGSKTIKELRLKHDLSVRELEVLERIVKGLQNKEIAEELFISTNTVKYHIRNLFGKLNISSRKEAASFYL